eukprot:NODE_747_length_4596_cov_0.818101.p1 type:complete len:616 gc:universal NODE_747_length_4596_cov_0.818101:1382-3229(+)
MKSSKPDFKDLNASFLSHVLNSVKENDAADLSIFCSKYLKYLNPSLNQQTPIENPQPDTEFSTPKNVYTNSNNMKIDQFSPKISEAPTQPKKDDNETDKQNNNSSNSKSSNKRAVESDDDDEPSKKKVGFLKPASSSAFTPKKASSQSNPGFLAATPFKQVPLENSKKSFDLHTPNAKDSSHITNNSSNNPITSFKPPPSQTTSSVFKFDIKPSSTSDTGFKPPNTASTGFKPPSTSDTGSKPVFKFNPLNQNLANSPTQNSNPINSFNFKPQPTEDKPPTIKSSETENPPAFKFNVPNPSLGPQTTITNANANPAAAFQFKPHGSFTATATKVDNKQESEPSTFKSNSTTITETKPVVFGSFNSSSHTGTFKFGDSSATKQASPNETSIKQTGPATPKPFVFGASTSQLPENQQSKPSTNVFGSTILGSNAVQPKPFSFTSNTSAPNTPAPKFSFGTSVAQNSQDSGVVNEKANEEANEELGDDTPPVVSEQSHIGAGEEDDVELVGVRCQLFDNKDKEFTSRGKGMLRITSTPSKTTKERFTRLLYRPIGHLGLFLNARIVKDMKIKVEEGKKQEIKIVVFMVFEGNEKFIYKAKMATEDADKFVKEFEKHNK